MRSRPSSAAIPRIDIGDISTAGGRLSFMVRNPTQVDAAVERMRTLTKPLAADRQPRLGRAGRRFDPHRHDSDADRHRPGAQGRDGRRPRRRPPPHRSRRHQGNHRRHRGRQPHPRRGAGSRGSRSAEEADRPDRPARIQAGRPDRQPAGRPAGPRAAGQPGAADGRRHRLHGGQAPRDGLGRPADRRHARASTRTAGPTSTSSSTRPARAASAASPRKMSASRSRSSSTTRSCRRRTSTNRSSAARRRSRGSFTVKSANDLAVSLASGKLPVKLNVIEERTISAELGKDSIHKGVIASVVGTLWRHPVHARHLRAVRRLREHRAGGERVPDPRHHGDLQRHADAAWNRRLHSDHRRRGRRQRADQRAHPRGDTARTAPARCCRDRLSRSVPRHFRRQRNPRHLGRRSWPISVRARCAASPSSC